MTEQEIYNEAFAAAQEAEAKYRAQYGEPFYCGFAWVKVRPGNCKFAKFLKVNKIVSGPAYNGGVDVWNPGKSPTQSMDIKEVGAHAFAQVLVKHGINAFAQSRAD